MAGRTGRTDSRPPDPDRPPAAGTFAHPAVRLMTTPQALMLGIAVTTFVVTGLDFLVRWWWHRHRDEAVLDLSERNSALQIEAAHLRQSLTAQTRRADAAEGERDDARTALKAADERAAATVAQASALADSLTARQGDLDELKKAGRTQENRLRRALALGGEIWTQEPMKGYPEFKPLGERRTPIVSVLNLKGGVGKTTVTAYLAWALARRGYRILLVDLDLQGSLSSLFLPAEELAAMAKVEADGKLLQHFLARVGRESNARILDHALPIPRLNPHSRLVAATDRLAYAELSHTFRWLLRVGGRAKTWNGRHDGRMILRRALHRPGVYSKFDAVLLDCPPLVNLCCANALAASDFVLTPLPPSEKVVERITPLLKRVLEVKAAGVNPSLNVLGLVLNNTSERVLTPREKDLLLNLSENCLTVYKTPVEVFDTTIPSRAQIRTAGGGFREPDGDLLPICEQLAEEFAKRLPRECRLPDEWRAGRKGRAAAGGAG